MGMTLAPLLDRAAAARQGGADVQLVGTTYDPSNAQRAFHRSRARVRLMVSGRGVGKSHCAAYELVSLVMDAPAGKEGAVLAPTYNHAEAAEARLREAGDWIGAEWKAQKKRLMLPGGRSIKVYSADRKDTVRSPSLVALWIDEGAYLSRGAIEAAMPALRSGDRRRPETVRKLWIIITTTPAGKNWVFQWWERAEKDPAIERFRFSSLDSPFMDPEQIELSRSLMSADKFAQEYLGHFVDNLLLVFPDRDRLFVDPFQFREREKTPRAWVGVDLGKTQDWTVLVLMNEWGEAEVLARWQAGSAGTDERRFWAQVDERVIAVCQEHEAQAVVDTGGPGGAPGSVLAERLREAGITVVEVKTNVAGQKAQIVEQAQADVEWQRVKVLKDDQGRWKHLDYEMSKFQGLKRVVKGQEINLYEGPQMPGEHDDCVVSFCLANWGRARDDTPEDPGDGGLAAFRPRSGPGPSSSRVGSRGYIFR